MNGLTLRISGGGSKKTKNTFNFPIVTIPEKCWLETKNEHIKNFIAAPSVDKQLEILKTFLNTPDSIDQEAVKFLVTVFLQAEVKHPVKCFVTRYITKNENVQQTFSVALSEEITSLIKEGPTQYKHYMDVVPKIANCIENFHAGAAAIKIVDVVLAEYLTLGLTCIVKTLSDNNTLSPTEKNEIFILAHSVLRLILYIVQKVSSDNVGKITPMFIEIRSNLKQLLFNEDVPMDTKSVCGIVYMSMHILENDPDSWVQILKDDGKDEMLESFLNHYASRLSLYSAVVIVVPTDKLQTQMINDVPAIVALTKNIIDIGERTSSDSTFNLGVTRTLVQISKSLDRTTDKQLGWTMVDILLMFVWTHLEHYMDSVRHLTAQALGNIVRYCVRLNNEGESPALDSLFSSLEALDRSRKSFYALLQALTHELGAVGVMVRVPDLVLSVIAHLHVQAIQASASTALETLLRKHARECSSEQLYECWVKPILTHVGGGQLDCVELGILEGLLTKAVKLNESIMDFILPHIRQSCDSQSENQLELKCVLMLLSVARKSGVMGHAAPECSGQWRDIIAYDVLRRAAVHSLQQTRILSLSLIVESPKSTEVFSAEELHLALHFLRYNMNAQAPNFRQLLLSQMKKFMKRFEDSYKVLKRQKQPSDAGDKGDYYLRFVERLRGLCFDSLLAGANYGRRYVALQLLVWCEQMQLDGYNRKWSEEYVEKLLLHLEDSYENNKAFALDVLKRCPVEFLQRKGYSTSLELKDILQQASSVKPTDCVSAAYKLELVMEMLPDNILDGEICLIAEAVAYTALSRLLRELRRELSICRRSVACAARDAPVYGLLHCATRVVDTLRTEAIVEDESWSKLIEELINMCIEVNAAVACVVNNSSPEGHLPMDMGGVAVTDHGNSGNVRLSDGRQVTAQMVLLCAWRSVKEVSLLLGSMCSRLVISEGGPGSLQCGQLVSVGEHFTALLAETKHRGAFEQAYVGFCALLSRLWRCRSPELHGLPRAWLQELMLAIQDPGARGKLCATRRSAGLPFMIQALVTTELQVRGNPTCFHDCITTLLRLARESADVTARTHAVNILRALFRNAALHDAVAPYVGEGLVAALAGFEGNTWEERNSSTLLFSALTVRIFGVQRSRDLEALSIRNRMTGRIFFLRYPQLYDLMLSKLGEVCKDPQATVLRPSLYPVLLLLARLYPSSLEGTVSNLKLVAFVPLVAACAGGAGLRARRLAARALLPLVSPELYIPHLLDILSVLSNPNISKNFCHGILLQLLRLIDNRPDDLVLDDNAVARLQQGIADSMWIMSQGVGERPCYLITDEFLKMINLFQMRLPAVLYKTYNIVQMIEFIDQLVFHAKKPKIQSGRDLCLANAANLYFILANIYEKVDYAIMHGFLTYPSYEVSLVCLNYILIMHQELELEDRFQEHLALVSTPETMESFDRPSYYSALCDIVKNSKYLECSQKALKILTLNEDTQEFVVQSKYDIPELTPDIILHKLIELIENEHENVTHLYLQSLSNYLTKNLGGGIISSANILEALRVIFACSSSDNSDSTRSVVVGFLDANIEHLLRLELEDLQEADKFEFKATLYATLVTMLEDDDPGLSQRTCDLICRAISVSSDVIPSRGGELLRDRAGRDGDALALLSALALLDFKSEVVMTDEGNDECRVFDQNERYNVYLEETIWTKNCAHKIRSICSETDSNTLEHILHVIQQSEYAGALKKLCGNHLDDFKSLAMNVDCTSALVNPKIELFIKELCVTQ